ncbi:Nicotinate phosphoribosyltransferase C-terminal domain, partial [Dillenia turbinata]
MDMEVAANGSTVEIQRLVIDEPTNPMVTPMLTDLYQFTMAYAYWKAGKHDERLTCIFGGTHLVVNTIFAGLEECIRFIANFKITEEDISFLRYALPSTCEDGFFKYLRGADCSDVKVYAIAEGSVVFPKIVQLLETPFLNLVNYASLLATNAARHRFVAGKSKVLLEFGLRRAQLGDCLEFQFGGLIRMLLLALPWYVPISSKSPDEIIEKSLDSDGSSTCEDFVSLVQTWLSKISGYHHYVAFSVRQTKVSWQLSLCLGIPHSSEKLRRNLGVPSFGKLSITASNDLNEETLDALNKQGHEIDAFGLGVVFFKPAEINNQPRIKLSEDVSKTVWKRRLPLVDYDGENEPPPKVGERLLYPYPFNESKRAYVVPQFVEELLKCYWPGTQELPALHKIRERCMNQLEQMRPDHMRRLNPTPYK